VNEKDALETMSASAQLVGSRIHVLRATAERDAAAKGARAQAFQEALSLLDETADLNEDREKIVSFLQLEIRRAHDEQKRQVHQRDAYTIAIGEAGAVAKSAAGLANGEPTEADQAPAQER
jgi:hypothetical protein